MIGVLRNGRRLLRILWVLGREDALFPELVSARSPLLGSLLRLVSRPAPGRPGQRLARALATLGPTFIKVGQALSTRADLVSEAVAEDLAGLQDKLPPFPAEQARAAIEAELGQPVDRLFRHFDDTPVAAASIAQVHFAETREGRQVAVKILRPGVEQAFARDLAMLEWLAGLAERFVPVMRRLRPREVVETFATSVKLEMDLRMEAAAAAELKKNFAGDTDFTVPAIDWERTARRVMTLDRIDGIPVDEVARIRAAGLDPNAVLVKAATTFFKMTFRDGYFHADLHPGNLFVLPDGRIAAVDFGIMGRLDADNRQFLADMLLGFLTGDYRRAAEVHFEAGFVPATQSIEHFTQACRAIGEPVQGKLLKDISLGRLLGQLFHVTEQFQMETQPHLLLLQKSMLTAEGVSRTLDPEANMWDVARPLIENWMREHRGPEARIAHGTRAFIQAVTGLPRLARELENAAIAVSKISQAQSAKGLHSPLPGWLGWAVALLLAIGWLVSEP